MKKIKLTQGKYAIIDDEFYEEVSKYKWHFGNGYAKRKNPSFKPKLFGMHHVVLPLQKGLMIDHINGNGLDNRRANLRLVTKSQNMMNRGKQINNKSGYMGVCWHKQHGRWRAYIKVNKKQISLGLYDTLKEAAKAYNEGAKKYHREYAYLNKI